MAFVLKLLMEVIKIRSVFYRGKMHMFNHLDRQLSQTLQASLHIKKLMFKS